MHHTILDEFDQFIDIWLKNNLKIAYLERHVGWGQNLNGLIASVSTWRDVKGQFSMKEPILDRIATTWLVSLVKHGLRLWERVNLFKWIRWD